MERERAFGTQPPVPTESEIKKIRPDRRNLPQNPASPNESQWPPKPRSEPSNQISQAQASTLSNPQTIGTSFTGASLDDSGLLPPDTMGAVGPSQFLVTVNGRVRSFNKNTGVADGVLNATTDVFFYSVRSGFGTSDPRVRFDRLSGRWFVVMINVALPNRVLLAVSDSGIITIATIWTFFFFQQEQVFPAGDANCLADYPTLGIDANALYIGVNQFCGTSSSLPFNGTAAFVVRKSSVLNLGPIVVSAFRNLTLTPTGTGLYTPQGVDNYDPAATEGYFVGVDNAMKGRLVILRVNNPGGAPSLSPNIPVTVLTTADPLRVNHLGNLLGSAGLLDALDDRLFAAHIRNGRLWTAHNIGVNNTGTTSGVITRTGSRWYELDLTTPGMSQAGTLFTATSNNTTDQRNYWIPSVMVSGQGHMALGCSIAGTTEFINAATVGRLAGDLLGTLQAPVAYTSSTTAYNVSDAIQLGRHRWGDYSYTSLDPCDDMTMWTIQEFCDATDSWGVRAVKLMAPPPALPGCANPSNVASGQTSVNVVITGISVAGSGFYDPGPGFNCRLNASVSGGVTVNSVTYNNPTSITLNISTVGASAGAKDVTVTNPDGQSVTGVGVLTVNGTGGICNLSCNFSISLASQNFTACGGTGTVNVTATTGCNWIATGSDSWITITSGSSGVGNGAVSYSVAVNTGPARTGTLTIAGQTFTVTQDAGPCTQTQPGSCTPPPAGMTDWWPGDDNANALVGLNDGTLQNGATFAPGMVSKAFSFDGVDDYVSFGNTAGNFGTSDFTVDFWIKTTSTRKEGVIGKRSVCGIPTFWDIRLFPPGHLFIEVSDGTIPNLNQMLTTKPVNDGVFHHVAVIRQGATLTVYLDGMFDNSRTVSTVASLVSNADLIAGKSRCTSVDGTDSFTGLLDEVEIFDRALSASDIQRLFNAGSAGKCRSCVSPPAGMISWVPGDGHPKDLIGANPGTLKNGAMFAPGMVGQAFSLDGVNDYVELPSDPSLNIGTGDLTIDAWIKPDSVNQVRPIVSRDNTFGFSMTGYSLDLTSGKLAFVTGDGTTFGYNVSSATIPVGVWTHVAATLNRSNAAGVPSGITLYINGVATSSTPGTVPGSIDAAVPLLIGRRPPNNAYLNHPGFFFDGVIDEVEIFNRALRPEEIDSIAKARSAGKCKSCAPPPPNMVAWLPGDGNANDIVGTSHGTLQNGATFATGIVGQAFNLDGDDDYVDVGGGFNLDAMTLDAWVFIDPATNKGERPVISKYPNFVLIGVPIKHFTLKSSSTGNDGRPVFEVAIGSAIDRVQSPTALTAGWHHIAGVRDYSTGRFELYADGQMFKVMPTVQGKIDSQINTLIGQLRPNLGPHFSLPEDNFAGLVDEVEIFDRAVGQSEIQAIYNAGGLGKCRSCVQPPPNMVAWLPGDGNTNDIAGTNHGTLQNGATFAPGRVGQAFSLNGTGAFVQAPDSPALNPGSQLTIDAWINPVSLVSNGQANRIVDKITGGSTNGYNFDIRLGRLRAIFGGNILTGAAVIPLNTWTHVAAVYDGTQLKLYVNGMLDAVSTAGGVIPSNTLPLRIGADSNGNSLFDGRIDEVEIFNRALSQSEILAIVNAGGAGKCK